MGSDPASNKDVSKFPPLSRKYDFWDLAADFEDSMRALIERGYPLNNVAFALSDPRTDQYPQVPGESPATRFLLTWTSRDGSPIEETLEQALLESIPITPATPRTEDPETEWTKIHDYILLRISAHYSGEL